MVPLLSIVPSSEFLTVGWLTAGCCMEFMAYRQVKAITKSWSFPLLGENHHPVHTFWTCLVTSFVLTPLTLLAFFLLFLAESNKAVRVKMDGSLGRWGGEDVEDFKAHQTDRLKRSYTDRVRNTLKKGDSPIEAALVKSLVERCRDHAKRTITKRPTQFALNEVVHRFELEAHQDFSGELLRKVLKKLQTLEQGLIDRYSLL